MPETKKYYHNLDVDNNKVINPLLNPLTTAQRTAVGTLLGPTDEGYVCFDTTLNQQYFWDGAAWVTVTATTAWGSITGVVTAQTDLTTYLAANYYPLATNPANYIDLTDLSAGTGISYNNLTGVITNSAPDQTVVLTGGTGISTSGTYPNFTITNTSPDQIVSLGTTGSGLSVTGTYPSFTLQNTLPDQTVALTAGTGIGITGTYPNFTITNSSPSSGGTVTGTGTTNYVPKWSSSTALTDSSIFDNGTSVGIGTATPDALYKLQVSGTIATTGGINLDTNPAFAKTGFYSGGNQFTIWAGNNQLGTYRLNGALAGSYFEHTAGFNNTGLYTGTQNIWRLAGNVTATVAPNTMNSTQLLINPTYSQGTFGSGILRGVYYNPTITSLNTSQHRAWENTSGDIIHGNLATGGVDEMVTVDTSGKLKKQAIPTGGGSVGFEMNFLLMGA